MGDRIFIDEPITVCKFCAACSASIPSIDIVIGQVRMTAGVSCIDETNFHILFGGNGPDPTDIDPVDTPRYGLLFLCLNATDMIKNWQISLLFRREMETEVIFFRIVG